VCAGLSVAGYEAAGGGSGLSDCGFLVANSPQDGEKWAKTARKSMIAFICRALSMHCKMFI
jgi:hypothetical protein